MIDLIKEIWQTMCTNKLRTMLTGLSVAWGIFMLILLLAIANGVINSFEENATANDPYRMTVWASTTSRPYKGLKAGRMTQLKEKNLRTLQQDIPDQITEVNAEIYYQGTLYTAKDYLSTSCSGTFPSNFNSRYKFIAGRPINDADMKERRKVIVLPRKSAELLFKSVDDAIGKTVTGTGLAFTVVGVYEHQWDRQAYMPFTTLYAILGFPDDLGEINVHITGVKDKTESAKLADKLRASLARTNNFAPDDESAVYIYDRFASYQESLTGLNILNITMWVIGLLTLLTGIVGVSNIMFVSVKERTHEIGIRRAIGAKPRSILVQIIVESVAMTTCFGYIGIVMGTLATEIVKVVFADSEFMLNPQVDISIAIEVTVALIIAGAIAGIFPAMRAIKVKPVEALRDE